ncbi:hypothetical protein [Hyperthermus butylicus]|uniref:Uncharacterized protein n=1 Tax=Hyperthermus butylicus (strain DSM 5456 / JCM 9403 / PLM1-5) TaxID=415426 RepID=A2BLE4_HYPBU|nr:hypothetical protein [Hyperthermus butylicus]ABM80805.1 hypothetical protein Hbut_0957 [Hyperthermus butylicus DSM 5456]
MTLLEQKLRIDADRATAELPLFLLYALAHSGGHIAPHEALAELSNDKQLSSIMKEFTKISKFYVALYKKYTNSLLALEKLAEAVNIDVIRRTIRSYTTGYLVSGKPLEVLLGVVNSVIANFEEVIRRKLSALTTAIEAISTLTAFVLLTVILASIFAENIAAIYLAALLVIAASAAIAISARIRVLDTYLQLNVKPYLGVAAETLALTALSLLVVKDISSTTFSILVPVLATGSLAIKLYYILYAKNYINSLKRLAYLARILVEIVSVKGVTRDVVVAIIKREGRDASSQIIYALRTGRPIPLRASDANKLAYLVSKTVSSALRAGGQAVKSLHIASAILELVSTTVSRIYTYTMAYSTTLAGVIAAMQLAIVLVANMLSDTTLSTTITSATASPLPFTQPLQHAVIDVHAAVILITVIGIAISYALTYASWRIPFYNHVPPIILLSAYIILQVYG